MTKKEKPTPFKILTGILVPILVAFIALVPWLSSSEGPDKKEERTLQPTTVEEKDKPIPQEPQVKEKVSGTTTNEKFVKKEPVNEKPTKKTVKILEGATVKGNTVVANRIDGDINFNGNTTSKKDTSTVE